MTHSFRITVIKPFSWTNAQDEHGVVHRVISGTGAMDLCTARCGLSGRWRHAERRASRYGMMPIPVLTSTGETMSCMTCIVREAKHATA